MSTSIAILIPILISFAVVIGFWTLRFKIGLRKKFCPDCKCQVKKNYCNECKKEVNPI